METKVLNEYVLDVGNSTTGPIGMVIRVRAETPEAALEIIKDGLYENSPLTHPVCWTRSEDQPGVIYTNCYTNAEILTVQDLRKVENEVAAKVEDKLDGSD